MKKIDSILIILLLFISFSINAQSVSNATISGLTVSFETVTASFIEDLTGVLVPQYQYQWYTVNVGVDSTAVGTSSLTYTIAAGDVGERLLFRVILLDGTTEIDTAFSSLSPLVTANTAPVASAFSVEITSNLNVGSTLLGKYTYSDAENNPEGSSTYVWQIADSQFGAYTTIAGATGSTYTLKTSEQGKWLRFRVTPVASVGATPGTTRTTAAVGPVNSAPTVSSVSIPLSISAGQNITVSYSYNDDDSDPNISLFQWYLNGVPIFGATTASYTVQEGDAGYGLKVIITPKSSSGYPDTGTPVSSNEVTVTASTSPIAENVCISGNRKAGATLTGNYTYSWLTRAQGTSTFEWLVDGVVTGVTTKTYVVQPGDVDLTIEFRVTPRSEAPVISGSPSISQSLTIITNTKTTFSVTEDSVEIEANPLVGTIPGADWVFTGEGVFESGGLYYFDPGDPSLDLADSPYEITEIYTTAEGCVQRDYIDFDVAQATVYFNPAQFMDFFCYEDVDVTIDVVGLPPLYTGANSGYLSGSGTFSLSSGGPGIISFTDTQVRINPQAIGPGNQTVSLVYSYILMNQIEILPGLYNYVPVLYIINRPFVIEFIDPALSITNLPLEYCEEGTPFDIFADNMVPGGGTGLWSSSILSSQDNLRATVNPSLQVGGGSANISFTYTTPIGCQRSVNSNIYINPSPDADFDIVDGCIEGNNDTIRFNNLTSSVDPVTSWLWTFDDINNNVSNSFEPGHLYRTAGTKDVALVAFTSNGCRDTASVAIELGIKPTAAFYWEDDCFSEGEMLNLYDATVSLTTIDSTTWMFNGGGAIRTNGIIDAAYLKTGAPGVVSVDYFVYTDYPDCSDTVSMDVFIRPTITLSDGDYYEDFESTDTVWVADSSPGNSWTLGLPNRTFINSAASGVNAYYTGFDQLNQESANYAVEGPCFDFRGVSRPMIKLNIWKRFDKNRDGAALQYKIGNSPIWEHVGTLNDGIEWYNSVTISGRPGGTQIGWTSLKENTTYSETRQKLDFLIGKEDVKLRLVYGSDGTSLTNDGLAFDDIWIGERTRTVLVEHFANNAETVNSLRASSVLNEIVENASKDVVNIQYHTNFPGEDLLYYDNPADPSARKLFYGLTKIPYTLYGGGNSLTSLDFANFYGHENDLKDADSLDLKKRSMVDPLFNLELNAAISNNIVTVTGELSPIVDINETNLTLYVAIVAREITDVAALNGETSFRNVLRKMLPSAGGTDLKKVWTSGENLTFGDFSWGISDIYDATELEVIAFIQNNHTKQVFQAATSGILGGFTSIGDFVTEESKFSIYPNPAGEKLNISFGKGLDHDSRIVIFNHAGVAVRSLEVSRTTEIVTIDSLNLPEGLYIVRLYKGAIPTGYRKLIITRR